MNPLAGNRTPCFLSPARLLLLTASLGMVGSLSLPAIAEQTPPPIVARPPTPAQQRQIQQMQERLRKMAREQDEELEHLVSELNGASRDKKIDFLTRIVTRLIEQRKAFHQESEAVRLRILDMQNPPAPLPRATAFPTPIPPPAPAAEKAESAPSTEPPPKATEQGYLPQ